MISPRRLQSARGPLRSWHLGDWSHDGVFTPRSLPLLVESPCALHLAGQLHQEADQFFGGIYGAMPMPGGTIRRQRVEGHRIMARIRSIKPDLWKHEGMSALSEPACLLALALLNYSDDDGYFNANHGLIRAGSVSLSVIISEHSGGVN